MSNPFIHPPTEPVNRKNLSSAPAVILSEPQKRRKQDKKPHNLDNKRITLQTNRLLGIHSRLNADSKHKSTTCSTCAVREYIGTMAANHIKTNIMENGRARFKGLQLCGSPNVCPKCGQIVGMRRAIRLGKWAEDEHSRGHTVILLTLTLQHQLGDMLKHLLAQLNKASTAMKNKYRAFIKVIRYAQQIESPFNIKTGWHPHFHLLLSIPPGVDHTIIQEMIEWWCNYHQKKGYYANSKAQHFEIVDNPEGAGQYISKVFNAGFEITSSSTKTKSESLSYSELLLLSETDPYYAARAKEYFEAINGRQLYRTSNGLKDILEAYDDQEDEDEDDKLKVIASLDIFSPLPQPVLPILIVIEQIKFNPSQGPPEHKAKIEAAFRKHKITAVVHIYHEYD